MAFHRLSFQPKERGHDRDFRKLEMRKTQIWKQTMRGIERLSLGEAKPRLYVYPSRSCKSARCGRSVLLLWIHAWQGMRIKRLPISQFAFTPHSDFRVQLLTCAR